MAGGGGDTASPPASNGGEFLLSLLHNKPHHQPPPPQAPAFDPAVAAMGPSVSWPHSLSPPPPNPFGFHHLNRFSPVENHDFRRLGFPGAEGAGLDLIHHLLQPKPPPQRQEHSLMFGSLPFQIQNNQGMFNGHLEPRVSSNSNALNALQHELGGGGSDGWGQQPALAPQTRRPPPGFPSKAMTFGNVDRKNGNFGDLSDRSGSISGADGNPMTFFKEDGRMQRSNMAAQFGISRVQLDRHGRHNLHAEIVQAENGGQHQGRVRDEMRKEGQQDDGGSHDLDDLGEEIVDLLLLDDESTEKSDKKKNRNAHDKDIRSDSRGQHLLSQRMRNFKRMTRCRNDIYKLNAHLYAIYESLIPPEEEKAKQRQLLALLEKLVAKEWPHARLYLYGSCASTFGVSRSDIDVCLAIDDADVNKPEVILKLAEILESDNLENVQALTRARVPIVKLMDPVTGISCDICINNLLAVVNTKLLRDYAQIDVRLHQLAFIVKHWAKSRSVNETYHGTLSSYAYVLMCIHFLQQRKLAILPCLQEMEATYSVTVDDVRCAFFDKVEKLRGFGSRNRESIAELVWGFFNYWAHCHDYANDVISVRTGSIISKRSKDWTRRVGNDRHLICIEDPFEISHDLGRVVDKYSIKVLREEFERAAHIMQHDPNPCISLFEPYVAS